MTVIGIGVALLIGGSVVTESVFAIPGPRPAGGRRDPAARLPDHPGRRADVQLPVYVSRSTWGWTCFIRCSTRGSGIERHHRIPDSSGRHRLGRARYACCRHAGRAAGHQAAWPGPHDAAPATRPSWWAGGLLASRAARRGVRHRCCGRWTRPRSSPAKRTAAHPVRCSIGSAPTSLGRDVYSRVIYRLARVAAGRLLGRHRSPRSSAWRSGCVSGFVRWADSVIMRVMDGLMSIPPILLAIALMALTRGSVQQRHHQQSRSPRSPACRDWCAAWCYRCANSRMSRRRSPAGTRVPVIIWRHIVPNTLAPITVQATYICASAMITEAILSRSSAPARRPSSRAGATSWPTAARCGRSSRILVLFPADLPVADGAVGEPAGRRAARRARSPRGEARMKFMIASGFTKPSRKVRTDDRACRPGLPRRPSAARDDEFKGFK